ncbi:MAG: hypothetical protein WC858_02665 [Parcubacteria group bacterium]
MNFFLRLQKRSLKVVSKKALATRIFQAESASETYAAKPTVKIARKRVAVILFFLFGA